MTDTKQPEALRLAEWLETSPYHHDKLVATELRRLHEENETLKKCLFQMQNAAIELAKPEQELPTLRQVVIESALKSYGKPEQEPVRWFQQFGDTPPRKEWVGLTDDEINDFDKKLRDNGDYCSLHFAWGISAKLKEKNT